MTNRKREFAKFSSGAAASDALGHMTLAFSDLLPIHALRISLTPKLNFFQIAIPGNASLLLRYYGWGKAGGDHNKYFADAPTRTAEITETLMEN